MTVPRFPEVTVSVRDEDSAFAIVSRVAAALPRATRPEFSEQIVVSDRDSVLAAVREWVKVDA